MASADDFKAQGNAALQAKDFPKAIEHYTKAIELNDSNHVYFSNRSAAYLSAGDADKALEDAEQVIKINATWPKGYGRKGAALHALGRHNDAIATYEEGLKVDPENAALKSGLADVEADASATAGGGGGIPGMGNPFGPDMFAKLAGHPKFSSYLADPAFVTLLNQLQSNPQAISSAMGDPRVMEVLGFLLGIPLSAGGPPGADAPAPAPAPAPEPEPEPEPARELTEEEKEFEAKKTEAEALKQQGTAHYRKREFDDALRLYKEADEANPDESNIVYRLNQAAVYYELKDYEQSIKTCEDAIEYGRAHRAPFPLLAKAFARIGNAHSATKNLASAIEAYQTSLVESHSDDVQKRLKKARVEKKALDEKAYLDPEKAEAAKEAGNVAFKDGNFPEAVKMYDEAIKRDPTKAVFWANRGAARTKLMDFDAAAKDIEQALKLDPKYVKAYGRKGALQFLQKEYHKAMDTYKAGLAVDPENAECREGFHRTVAKIQELSRGGAPVDKERASRAMADPEIQGILSDPVVQQVLKDLQENPASAQSALRDPGMSAKLEKLIAAGVIRMG